MSVGVCLPEQLSRTVSRSTTAETFAASPQTPAAGSAPWYLILEHQIISDGWETVGTLYLTVEQDEGRDFITFDDRISVYGEGHTVDEALRDYLDSLIEYYELLEARSSTNVHNQALFNAVKQLIGRTS